MKIVLCDDDKNVLSLLEKYLREYFQKSHIKLPEISSYTDGETLLAQEERVDIAILDVEMPGLSGIHVGRVLQKRNPYTKIIILTSYADYLDEAMKFHVFRYLSKPIDKNRLFRNLKEALHQYSMDTVCVAIETHDGVTTRYADEIVMVEAQGHNVTVYAANQKFCSVYPMKYWDRLLKIGSFYKTHRSYIVNMKYISSFSHDMVFLTALGEQQYRAYLTKRRYRSFKDAYLLYLEGAQ